MTLVLVDNAAVGGGGGGDVHGAGISCTGAETKEIEKGKSEGEKAKRG